MKFHHAVVVTLALLLGAAAGYMFNPETDRAPVTEPPPEKAKRISDSGESASVAALRRRIAELEKLLAERDSAKPSAEAVPETPPAETARAEGRPQSPREWRERMMKEDPERYVRITNHFARVRRERRERAEKKIGFLASIDTSGMSAAARKVHDELMDTTALREELEQRMQRLHEGDGMEQLGEDERRALFEEMHRTDHRLRELNRQERENLLDETAKNLGFSGDEAKEIADTVREIVDSTENSWGGHWRGRGPGGPGGPGGRGPGGPGGPGGRR